MYLKNKKGYLRLEDEIEENGMGRAKVIPEAALESMW